MHRFNFFICLEWITVCFKLTYNSGKKMDGMVFFYLKFLQFQFAKKFPHNFN